MKFKKQVAVYFMATSLFVAPISNLPVYAQTSNQNATQLVGAWEINQEVNELTDQEKEVFAAAVQDLLGVDYQAIRLMAKQTVAGTNFAFLAKATTVAPNANPHFVLVYASQALDGKVTLLGVEDVTEDDDLEDGFVFNEEELLLEKNEAANQAFNQLIQTPSGKVYKGLILLDQTNTNNISYRILAIEEANNNNPARLVRLTIQVDKNQEVQLKDIDDLELGDWD